MCIEGKETMLRVLVEENLTVVRSADNSAYVGTICEVKSPYIRLCFQHSTDLKIGDQVKCAISRDGSHTTVVAQVTELNGKECELWMLVQNLVPGVDRAPRAVAPGTTVTMIIGDEKIIGSICDVSESGLRIRSLGRFEVGQDMHLWMETQMGEITFSGRVARVVHGVDNDSSDIGVQILEIGRLERARYDHFVDGLLRRARRAA